MVEMASESIASVGMTTTSARNNSPWNTEPEEMSAPPFDIASNNRRCADTIISTPMTGGMKKNTSETQMEFSQNLFFLATAGGSAAGDFAIADVFMGYGRV